MRKKLNVKMSWMSEENFENAIKLGYLPILAVNHPKRFRGTKIHFPELAPKVKDFKELPLEEAKNEYLKALKSLGNPWKILNKFDLLAHLSSASGIMILTEKEKDPYREVLSTYFNGILDSDIVDYEW